MSHTDHALWQQCWRDTNIEFHLNSVHPLLPRFWPLLKLERSDRVFVPLCGKSLDLMWLHGQGHDVVGIELSPVAIRAFFTESGLKPRQTKLGSFIQWEQDRLKIFCGDFFKLSANDLLGVKALYDRAALTALPEDIRALYVEHLAKILPADCLLLLITVEDLDDDEEEASACEPSAEITQLYGEHFDIELQHAECFPVIPANAQTAAEPRSVHKTYVIRRTNQP